MVCGVEIWLENLNGRQALAMTKKIEIIGKTEFAVMVLNINDEIFLVHEAALAELIIISIHFSCEAQVVSLIIIEILVKYFDFLDVFFSDFTMKLPKHTKINNYLINLFENKQLLYGQIYSLRPVKVEILKTYIKANLTSFFISPFQFSIGTLILFIWKKNCSFYLCIGYQELNY